MNLRVGHTDRTHRLDDKKKKKGGVSPGTHWSETIGRVENVKRKRGTTNSTNRS